jgi:hypothetical protein
MTMLFVGASLQAEWVKVTDFDEEGGIDNNVVGYRVWSPDDPIPAFVGAEADPAPWAGDEGNMALHIDHNNYSTQGMESAYMLFPQDIENGTTATLYFRWWMSKNGGHEMAMMLTDTYHAPPYNVGDDPNNTVGNGYGEGQTWWRIGNDFAPEHFGFSSPEFQNYWPEDLLGPQENGWGWQTDIPENQIYESGVWMEMWIVYDTANDIKTEYQVQSDGVQKRNNWAITDQNGAIQSTIDYQPNRIGPTEMSYSAVYMVNWQRALSTSDTQVYLDDVWIDFSGENLTTPPHGKTRSGAATWAGFPVDGLGWVDTGSWLGFVNVAAGDYVWSASLNNWMYLPEVFVSPTGAWTYILNTSN